jgi:release factor glutamine methyltransferase
MRTENLIPKSKEKQSFKQEKIFKNLLSILDKNLSILPDKCEETSENTLRALWLTASGYRVSPIVAETLDLPSLSSKKIELLNEFVQKRIDGIPLAHITERQNFFNIDLILAFGSYIPRKDTELLAKTTIDLIEDNYAKNPRVTVLDLCTGIGSVALAIAKYCKNSFVYGSDIYSPAIELAKINADKNQLHERTAFFNSDMFSSFKTLQIENSVDIIVSAPPYFSTEKAKKMAPEISNHEPNVAFDGGPYGLSIFNDLIKNATVYLNDNGYLIFECGKGQEDFLANRIESSGYFQKPEKIYDERGIVCVVKAKRS